MSEDELAARSVAAVSGRVTAIEAVADPESGGINTYIHIEPSSIELGSLPAGPLVLRERGGRLRDKSEWIFGSPEYRVGEDVLVFLSRNADGTLRTTSMSMGKFSLETVDGARTAIRNLGEGAAVWDPRRGQLVSDPSPESYELETLLHTVRAARLGGLTRKGMQVHLVPPELARAAQRESQASFTYLSNPSRWFEPDEGQAVPFAIDGAGDLGIGATNSRAAINDAFAAWTDVPTSNLILSDAGNYNDTLGFAGCSGGNRIMFNDPLEEVTDPVGCSGVLAIGGFCASSETRVVNGTNFRRIRVGKIMFNDGWASCPGWNRCNLAEVATHEIGHTLGFGHATDYNATMYASAHFDGRCASLRTDDLAAVNFVYPGGVAFSPSPTRTPLPPTATSTRTRTSTPTRTRTATPTRTRTATPTTTSTSKPTVPTATLVPTHSATPTRVPSSTPTNIPPPPATSSPTATASLPPPSATPTVRRRRVHGRVQYYSSARGVPDVTVNLSGVTHDERQTSDIGTYEFDDVAPGTWELVAQKTSGFGEGVSPLDAAYVLQAIANVRRFDASQRLACDVTGDGQLSALDAARILQFSVGNLTRLPVGNSCNSDWTFVPDPAPMQQRSVTPPSVSAGSCSGGSITLQGLEDEMPGQDFRAILFGDCTGNWHNETSAALGRAASPRASRIRLGRASINGSSVKLPVYVRATSPYNALDLQIAYDPSRLTPKGIVLRRSSDSGLTSFHAPQPGSLRVAMASGEPIKRRFGMLMQLEFTLAAGVTDPGDVWAMTAKIDEQPASIKGSSSFGRR